MPGVMHTEWSAKKQNSTPMSDEEKHLRFSGFAQVVANSYAPWLLPLLDAANATVYASVGKFLFILPDDPGKWHEIPELSALLSDVPWTECEEEGEENQEACHGAA